MVMDKIEFRQDLKVGDHVCLLQHLNAAANDTQVGTDGLTEETCGGSLTSQASVGTEHSPAVSLQRRSHIITRCHSSDVCS